MNVQPVEHVFGLIRLDGLAEHFAIDTRAQTETDLCAFNGASYVPAFRFAARQAIKVGAVIVRMHLHAEFLAWKQKLDEQRKTVCLRRSLACKLRAILRGQSA
jgi:hypothetical protein